MGEFLFVCLFVVVLRGVFVMVVFFACLLLFFVLFVVVCFCNGRGGWEEVEGVVVCRGNSSSFQNALS